MKPLLFIGIAGGSGSGKSTFTENIKNRFPNEVAVLYHDDYYRDQSHLSFEERCQTNYDHPDSLETELLLEHLEQLGRGEFIECPVYDFTLHNRSDRKKLIEPKPVILVEGILILSDPRLVDLFDLKVFVDTDADVRITRRIVRDVKERGRDLEGIINQYMKTVKPMHNRYVEPSRYEADIIINSGRNPMAFAVVESYLEKLIHEGERREQ